MEADFLTAADKASWIVKGLIVIVVWALARTFAKRDDLVDLASRFAQLEEHIKDMPSAEKVNKDICALENQLATIGTHIKHLPDDTAVSRINNRIDQVGQGMRHLEGEMKQINQTLHLIQQYLLEKD